MHPISVQIITRDGTTQREVRQQYTVQAKHPRWEMLKIFVHAFFHTKVR